MLVNIKNINKSYKNQSLKLDILKNIEFEIEEQDFIALMGPSGSGKSTLLNLIAGLDKPDNGSIFFSNNDICKMNSKEIARFRRDYLGFVFQEYNLIDTLTASENIALALTMKKYNVNEIEEKINKIMRILSIDKLSNKLPYQLSGGERQRVACARALIKSPKLILADEPTGALDSKSAKMLLEKFDYLNKELQATILMVTHDAFTASYSSRVIFIKDDKIFNEIIKGTNSRKEFFDKIIDVVTLLGGDLNDAL